MRTPREPWWRLLRPRRPRRDPDPAVPAPQAGPVLYHYPLPAGGTACGQPNPEPAVPVNRMVLCEACMAELIPATRRSGPSG